MSTIAGVHALETPRTCARPYRDSSHAYATLLGGKGRAAFYRLERTAISESDHQFVHEVHIGELKGLLLNYTPHGLAFSVPSSKTLAVDDLLEVLEVSVGEEVVYQGTALVRHTRLEQNQRLVGVALVDGILDPDRLLSATARSTTRMKASGVSVVRHSEIRDEYRRTLADAVYLLNSYRALLDAQEAELSRATKSSARARAGLEVLKDAELAFRDQFSPLRGALNHQSFDIPKQLRVCYQHYTEALIHPAVLCAPAAYHCYKKPLGYPGDFMLMSYLYSEKAKGDSLYAKLIHQVVVREEPLAHAVRQRKEFLLAQIRQTVTKALERAEVPRILSLGCGPAQEIRDLLLSELSTKVAITLIDQDRRCLAHVDRSLSMDGAPQHVLSSIQYLHLGLRQLLQRKEYVDAFPLQDLIYSAGVFDYLGSRLAQRLAHWLYQRLRPGGQLVIGNVRRTRGVSWSLDYWMDWPLIYRNKEEMLVIAGLIPDDGQREVAVDASGYTYMLLVRKP